MLRIYHHVHALALYHRRLWGSEVRTAWNRLTLEEKIIYLLFINQLIAILTLLELLIIKK